MVSGLLAMFAADTYLWMIGSRIHSLYHGALFGLLRGTWNLQGGDAFVAGSARGAVALLGSTRLKQIMAVIGLGHSAYELWILPTVFIAWCNDTPAAHCGVIFRVGVAFFMGLHVLLVTGFVLGLALTSTDR